MKLTIDELREMIHNKEASDPLVFLECVMNGQDPRVHSKIYGLVNDIDGFCDGVPTKAEWQEVVELVNASYKYQPVKLSESSSAAKTLAEYLHAKRKNIELSETSNVSGSATPLTEEEIELFREKFNDQF